MIYNTLCGVATMPPEMEFTMKEKQVNNLPFGKWADVGNKRLFYYCMGTGSPLVVLETGLGSTSEDYHQVMPLVAGFTRVMCYDRAGLGSSTASNKVVTCQTAVNDLRGLLLAAQLPPPYILVGHSWGGLNMRLFASQFPDEVAGMIMLDAVHEDRYERFAEVLSPELRHRMMAAFQDPQRNDEQVDRVESIRQIKAARKHFDFPITVITRGLPDEAAPPWPVEAMQKIEVDLQTKFLSMSEKNKQVVAENSHHFIQCDQPRLVVKMIREMVQLARAES